MPLVQYCRKCCREVPLADVCAHCGSRLSKNSETYAFDVIHVPARDWFCWNSWLRLLLPGMLLAVAAVVITEGVVNGAQGALRLLSSAFLPVMLGFLCLALLVGLVMLRLQRGERIHYAIDKVGLHAWTYLEKPTSLQLYTRLMSRDTVRLLETDERALPDMTLIRHQFLPWKEIRRAYFWQENAVLLLYNPRWWQVMAVRCPVEEIPALEKLVQLYVKPPKKKTGRGKKKARKK